MSIPPINTLEETAKKFVWEAKKNGTLSKFTPRSIRQALEQEFALEEGTLDAPECKKAIKAATKYAVDNDPPASVTTDSPKPKAAASGSKRKSSAAVKDEYHVDEVAEVISKPKGNAKSKSKSKVVISDEEGDEEEQTPKKRKVASKKDEGKPANKRKSGIKPKQELSKDEETYSPKPTKNEVKATVVKKAASDDEEESDKATPVTSAGKSKTKKDTKAYKSQEHVPTSDMEQDDPVPEAGPSVVMPNKSAKVENNTLQSTSKIENDPTPSKPLSAKRIDTPDNKSDSEMSVLIDEPPKKKRKSNNGEKGSKKSADKPKAKKTAKSSATLSKDEETIKRLKSLVVACGTRKVWSKVFQDLDSPQQQIKKLKEILAELGMTGRLSMEQAKAIKEKRELDRELADVTEFAAKIQATQKPRAANKKSDSLSVDGDEEENASSESEAEEVQAPRKRPLNARKSIMAFLGDQSDDD